MFQLGDKVAIKIFVYPEIDEKTDAKVRGEIEQSHQHFYAEEIFLNRLSHPNIIRIHQAVRDTEMNVPIFIREQCQPQLPELQRLKQKLRHIRLVEQIDRMEWLQISELKQIYSEAVRIKPCSYLVMDFAQKQNLY